MTYTFARHALKRLSEIGAKAPEGESRYLSSNATDHAARRMAAIERLGTISPDRVARADTVVPRAQRGEGSGAGNEGGVEERGIFPV